MIFILKLKGDLPFLCLINDYQTESNRQQSINRGKKKTTEETTKGKPIEGIRFCFLLKQKIFFTNGLGRLGA